MDTADTVWVMVATALVVFMTIPGLALFYGGLVQSRNVLSVLMQVFVITCIVSIAWLVCGYSLTFGDSTGGFIGNLDKVMFNGVTRESMTGTVPEIAFALFQLTFAAITPALIIGGIAERVRFAAVLSFSLLWVMLVYVPVAHWVWGGGWLAAMGFIDFAGGTVVHITAGVSALVCALCVGPREGFGKVKLAPHNMTMTVTGAGMLWVGWFGFNGGSALVAGPDAAMAIFVTHIAAATGALAWSMMEARGNGRATALGAVTGMVAGLGTITPAAGVAGPGGALAIGFFAGITCYYATHAIKNVLRIDDSLDVFPVHGVGGMLGTAAAAIFASDNLGVLSGAGYADGMNMGSQSLVQGLGITVVLTYSAALTWGITRGVQWLVGWRVSEQDERDGLDLVSHDERGYAL